ncbi:acyltransferase family protein [Hymenobacter arizonensis]|uniref:Peptidoglycan/LPS O-acetylase OafA/YrhL, contains acyltransferase and SGNH-hydrolase domains n=1 Tax=Hymenobacter arizonensis TaxID=1227077 RepID=A0A1I5UVI9_HYMAR|nr:acyltransferase [Hymenobacter arizonensis]SFP99220.1 Peptidoglycan/LPS O-acetylase OafA/YrhL, contains acyltransferase and SGNH-hydrolase domains [Hymenobacter arizonensis]
MPAAELSASAATTATPGASASGGYLPALTGLRAIAAWLVFCNHYPMGPIPPPGIARAVQYLVDESHGLPLLLLLSGFLIALRYDSGTANFRPKSGWRHYLLGRLARIYPLYALLTLATFALLWRWQSPQVTPGIVALNLTLLRSFFDDYKFTGIGQAWSLTLFECFYLAAPFVLGLQRRGLPLWLQPLILLGLGTGLVALLAPLSLHGLFGSHPFMLSYTFFGHSLEFFVGVWLAGRYQSGRLGSPAGMWRTVGGVWLYFAVTVALGLTQAQYHNPDHPLTLVLNLVGLPAAAGLLFAGLLSEHSKFRQLLSGKLFQKLGLSSYSFYLIHAGPLSFWVYESLPGFWLLQLLAVQLVSYGLYKLVEIPLSKWLKPAKSTMASAVQKFT